VNLTMTVGLAVSVPVACWLAICSRLVPRGQRVAVVRRAAVRRVHDAGVAFRMPFVESFVTVPTGPLELPLLVRTTTSDGLRVVLAAEAMVELPRPEPGIRYADPWATARLAAEDALALVVTGWSSDDVLRGVPGCQAPLRHALSVAVDGLGVTVHDLELVGVDVQADEGALARAGR